MNEVSEGSLLALIVLTFFSLGLFRSPWQLFGLSPEDGAFIRIIDLFGMFKFVVPHPLTKEGLDKTLRKYNQGNLRVCSDYMM